MSLNFFSFLIILLLMPGQVFAGAKEKIAALAPSGMVLVLDENGKELIAQNTNQSFVPASVTKLVTAWLAMEVLGPDYRFKTQFYLDDDRVLYVRGGGDPFLISEELAILAQNLVAETTTKPFTALVLDASYYPEDIRIPGIKKTDEAYDALNSALAANFNTIHAVRKGKTVRSAEKQTPITPLAVSQFRKRGPKKGRGRISLAQENPSLSVLYAGELLAEFIKRAGGSVDGKVSIGQVPQGTDGNVKLIYVHNQSRNLEQILTQLLLGSNNYIANQIFLEIGANRKGGPVSLQKSLMVTNEIFAKHNLTNAIQLKEGSGISSENKFTAKGLATVLHQFSSHANLLRKTRKGSRYKTGTLSDVKTLAGYAETRKHGRVRFVIALGGRTGKLRFRILRTIEKEL